MIYLITGNKSSGKTTTICNLQRKYKGDGFYSLKVIDKNNYISYYVVRFSTGEKMSYLIEKSKNYIEGNIFQRFNINNKAIKKCNYWINTLVEMENSNIFIDEIGKLELEYQQGFYSMLERSIDHSKKCNVFMTIRENYLNDLVKIIEDRNEVYEVIHPVRVGIIIMASGYSRRMGDNKLLMPIEDKTIVEYMLDKVIGIKGVQIILIARQEEVITKIRHYENIIIKVNNNAHNGISQTIIEGVKEATDRQLDAYMFLPCDQVGITKDIIEKILMKYYTNPESIIVPVCNGLETSPVIFPKRFKNELLNISGDKGGKQIWQQNMHEVKIVDVGEENFNFDIDDKEDYNQYLKKLSGTKKI